MQEVWAKRVILEVTRAHMYAAAIVVLTTLMAL